VVGERRARGQSPLRRPASGPRNLGRKCARRKAPRDLDDLHRALRRLLAGASGPRSKRCGSD
jgi:hypothetical protein